MIEEKLRLGGRAGSKSGLLEPRDLGCCLFEAGRMESTDREHTVVFGDDGGGIQNARIDAPSRVRISPVRATMWILCE